MCVSVIAQESGLTGHFSAFVVNADGPEEGASKPGQGVHVVDGHWCVQRVVDQTAHSSLLQSVA